MDDRLYQGTTKRMLDEIDQRSSSRLTAIQRLADYCKQFSVAADIVMDTDEQSSDKRYAMNGILMWKNILS